MKPVVWIGDSLERLREFPADARRDAGYQLEQVQAGRLPVDWKPMPSVLHAFQKKSRKTSRMDIGLARKRFAALVEERRQQ